MGNHQYNLRSVTRKSTNLESSYLDFLIDNAAEAAEKLPYDHEDLERERDRAESPSASPAPATKKQRIEEKIEDKKPSRNAGRRRRKQKAKNEKRKQEGWRVSLQVRTKISQIVSTEQVGISMLEKLADGTQLGGYRPRAMKMEADIEGMMKRMKSAYDGTSATPSEDVLADLKATGYEIISWDGINPILLTDTEDRVFSALAGQPTDPRWSSRCMELFEEMVKDEEKYKALPQKNQAHRRGRYTTIGTGITFAPGDKKAHNLHLTTQEEEVIYRVDERKWRLKSDIRKFVEASFDLYAPRLYRYYLAYMDQLRANPQYAHLMWDNPFENPEGPQPRGFASHAENHPPSAFTVPHRDTMNLAFGWCAIVALGRFNAQAGGHLVLHDLKLIIPFPHGSLIFIPSAFLWHSNVPIQKADSRASVTFFSSGGLFRFINNNFQTEADYISSLDEVDEDLHMIEKKNRVKIGVSLYSKAEEILNPDSAESESLEPLDLSIF